jgi:hypothetical protein
MQRGQSPLAKRDVERLPKAIPCNITWLASSLNFQFLRYHIVIYGSLRFVQGPMTLRPPTKLIWDGRLSEKDKALVAQLNSSMDRLDGLRAVEINPTGPFGRSKIAWKLVTYQHVLLHRIVALIDGVAVAWNAQSALTALLAARAFMETFAVMDTFEQRVGTLLTAQDLGGLDALAQNGIFASRDPDMIDDIPEIKATNAVTFVDKFDKRASGFRGQYDRLSERCHPNAAGHNFMFAKLDRANGSVSFFEEREPEHNGQLMLGGLITLPLVESIMSNLDGLIAEVSDLHHRVAPVGGSAGQADPPR